MPPCLCLRGLRLLGGFLRSLRASCNCLGLFSTEWTLWSSLFARSCCSALTFASLVAAAVAEGLLCFFAAERWWAGGRSPSWRGSTLTCSEEERSLSLQVLRCWSKYDCCLHNTGCLERRSSQAVLRGSRLRLEEAGSTILIVSWSTRRAFSCPHRALKAP